MHKALPETRPLLCLVTDRHRLSPGASDSAAIETVILQVREAARAGVQLIQIRERDLEGGALYDLVRACVAAVRTTDARVIVNDRLDVAVPAGAAGVHLRADSMSPERVREIVPTGFLVGRSVHAAAEADAIAAGGCVDYLILGTIFRSVSKAFPPPQPASSEPSRQGDIRGTGASHDRLDELARAANKTTIPILAIGGIDRTTIPRVAGSGAAGFAAIGFFIPERRGEDGLREGLCSSVEQATRLFDTR